MSKKIKIPVVTCMYDNQDGGYTMYAYNNEDELIADHRKADEMTPELREEILSGDDEYENGYVSTDSILVVLEDDGRIRLAEPLSFHAGQ